MSSYNPKNCLILAVDDNLLSRALLENILQAEGYRTKIMADSEEVLVYLEYHNPDLILLDLVMPKIDGLRLCRQIKSNPKCKDIPIIFITASEEKENLLQAFKIGAVDYITKPFHPQELLARVRTHLDLKFTRDELRKALRELEKLATTDELTGVANRRHFSSIAEREFNLAKRQKRHFSILVLDIDFFKKINDTYGHAAGDYVIKSVACYCNQTIRKEDILARWGGEEFIILLPETALQDAVRTACRLREGIANLNLEFDSHPIAVTVSIGVSYFHEADASLNDTIIRGDQALYRAKNLGRNVVVDENGIPYKRWYGD
ncbi:MAG TPA: diguanylate cyclase [Geminocystis sp. M7585_C2015_104]|nr:diguanylate cyclase [Geminocystis sp. M7585_C2015_104]